ncbi:MAG TPA: hypothetical protein VFZ66_29505 [Herpetosiphonaceae bacterium]
MARNHTLFENSRLTTIGGGSIVNTTLAGTAAGTVPATDYQYHAYTFAGTIGNTGTVFVYAVGAGLTNSLLGSLVFGSSTGQGIIYEVKSDVLSSAGTGYTHFGANLKVDSGGTLGGAFFCLSTTARTAGTTPAANGYAAVGTTLV